MACVCILYDVPHMYNIKKHNTNQRQFTNAFTLNASHCHSHTWKMPYSILQQWNCSTAQAAGDSDSFNISSIQAIRAESGFPCSASSWLLNIMGSHTYEPPAIRYDSVCLEMSAELLLPLASRYVYALCTYIFGRITIGAVVHAWAKIEQVTSTTATNKIPLLSPSLFLSGLFRESTCYDLFVLSSRHFQRTSQTVAEINASNEISAPETTRIPTKWTSEEQRNDHSQSQLWVRRCSTFRCILEIR